MFYFTVRLKTILKFFLCTLFILMLILNPEQASSAAKEGFNISLYLVLPSLFPFAVISSFICSNFRIPAFLTKTVSRITGISAQGVAPLVMGIISGYPVGSILIGDAVSENRLSVKEAEHLLPFSCAAGPLFMIGVLGSGMFGSVHIGYFLYTIHIISILSLLILLKAFAPKTSSSALRIPKKVSLIRTVDKSMSAMLNVMGCIAFFSVVSRMLSISGVFEIFSSYSAVPHGILELTSGLNRLALSELSLRLKLSLASFLCGFSGICIFLQVSNAVKETKISLKKYVILKLMTAILAFILTYLIYPLIPLSVPTFTAPSPMPYGFIFHGYGLILFLFPIYKFIKNKAPFFDNR